MKQVLFSLLLLAFAAPAAQASITLYDKDSWSVQMSGFVETDIINDSTRSYTEVAGSSPVARPDATSGAGNAGRTQFSIRNSRLAFSVMAPELKGWHALGYTEMDFLGYDPNPGSGTSEGGYYNNPTMRIRHAYMDVNKDGWHILTGQTWALLGWQPYYFIPSVQVAPLPGQLYSRTAQVRAVKVKELANNTVWQSALGVMRPPQRDSSFPNIEAGTRLVFGNRSSGFAAGSTSGEKAQPMSVGVSGSYREIVIPQNNAVLTNGELVRFPGYAGAADFLLPVIASYDGKDVSNTFTIGGEYSVGKGYGDEFSGWTGGQPSPLNSSTTAPDKNVNLDAGIGGFDGNNNFQLIKLSSFSLYGQYHLSANTRTWFSGGYSQLRSNNMASLTGDGSAAKALYGKQSNFFMNIFRDVTKQVRMGLEYSHFNTVYADAQEAHDNRYQFSTFFIF